MNESDPLYQIFFQAVREAFGVVLSPQTVDQLRRAVTRVGVGSAPDLVSSVLLACYEDRKKFGRQLTDEDIRRAVWRVAKEVTREAAHWVSIDPNRVATPLPPPPPDAIVMAAEQYAQIICAAKELSDRDWLIVVMWADGWKAGAIASEVGVTPEVVRQVVSRSLKQIRRTIECAQKPVADA